MPQSVTYRQLRVKHNDSPTVTNRAGAIIMCHCQNKQRFLIVREHGSRDRNGSFKPGLWGFAKGTARNNEKTPLQTAINRCKEETGITPTNPLAMYNIMHKSHGYSTRLIYYLFRIDGCDMAECGGQSEPCHAVTISPAVAGYLWVTFAELMAMRSSMSEPAKKVTMLMAWCVDISGGNDNCHSDGNTDNSANISC